MPSQLVATSHPSAASDLARLAIPLAILAASIAVALWIDRAGVTAEAGSQARGASVHQATP